MLSSLGQSGPELYLIDPSGVTWVILLTFIFKIFTVPKYCFMNWNLAFWGVVVMHLMPALSPGKETHFPSEKYNLKIGML